MYALNEYAFTAFESAYICSPNLMRRILYIFYNKLNKHTSTNPHA